MYFHSSVPTRSSELPRDIIRNPRLSGTAKSLLLWALSLPSDTNETFQSIGEQMPEGKVAVSRARKQLIDEGYVHVRREQRPGTGRWASRVLVCRVPVTDPEAVEDVWRIVLEGGVPAESAKKPSPGNAAGRVVGTSTPVVTTGVKTTHPGGDPVKPGDDAPDDNPDGVVSDDAGPDDIDPPGGAGAVSAEQLDRTKRAIHALSRLVDRDRRLRLGAGEVMKLAELAAEWLARGATEHELTTVLVAGLPPELHSPMGLLRNRLLRKMPELPEPKPQAPERHECGRCQVPVPRPGICRPCAGLPEPSPASESLVDVTLRGAARARAAMVNVSGRARSSRYAPGW